MTTKEWAESLPQFKDRPKPGQPTGQVQLEDLTPEKLLQKNPKTGAWEHNPEAMKAAGAAIGKAYLEALGQ